jgi:hypothetical protein
VLIHPDIGGARRCPPPVPPNSLSHRGGILSHNIASGPANDRGGDAEQLNDDSRAFLGDRLGPPGVVMWENTKHHEPAFGPGLRSPTNVKPEDVPPSVEVRRWPLR